MKKKKWLINITTLALALCVMAFGVYAAKSASLSTSGSIGFISHDADVTVVGTITGAMRGQEYGFKQITQEAGKTTTVVDEEGNETSTVWQDSFTTVGGENGDYLVSGESWVFGDIYFDDMNQEGDTVSTVITFTFNVTNYSDFNVLVQVTGLESVSIPGVSVDTTKAIILANSGTPASDNVTITFTITDAVAAESADLTAIAPVLSVTRTDYSDMSELPAEVTTDGWNGYVITEGVNIGKFQITQVPVVNDGESLTVPALILNDDGKLYETVLATDNEYGGYLNSSNKFVVTSVPEDNEIETVSNSMISHTSTVGATSDALSTLNKVKVTTESTDESVYVPGYILSNGVVYETTVCSTEDGWGIGNYGAKTSIARVPSGSGTLVIPSIFNVSGVITKVSRIRFAIYADDARAWYPQKIFNVDEYTEIVISKGITLIDQEAFSGCSNLNKIRLEEGLENISIEDTAFNNCPSLPFTNGLLFIGSETNPHLILYKAKYDEISSQITIPKGCKIILNQVFDYCTNLQGVTFEEGSQIERIGSYVFRSSGLTSITVPASVKIIDYYAFNNCTSLNTIMFPENSQLQSIGNFAFSNTAITNIKIPEGVTSIGESAFSGCVSLGNITFEGNSQLNSIGASAFNGCPAISAYSDGLCYLASGDNSKFLLVGAESTVTSVTIPSECIIIGPSVFQNNSSLTQVIFEENSQLKVIGDSSFRGTGIISLQIPNSVIRIDSHAFNACSLSEVVINSESQLTKLGTWALGGASAVIIDNVNFATTGEIGMYAFGTYMYATVEENSLSNTIGTYYMSYNSPSMAKEGYVLYKSYNPYA